VAAPVQLGQEPHARVAPAHVEGPYALRAVELVGGERDEVEPERLHVQRDLARRLRRVAVEEHAAPLREPPQLRQRLHDADLVVGVHHRQQDGAIAERPRHVVGVDEAIRPHREAGHVKALALEPRARVQDRAVLGRDGQDVVAALAEEPRHTLEREVVGLGRAAREDDLAGGGADERRHLLPRRLHGLARAPAEDVLLAGGVAELLREPGRHRREDLRVDRRRGVVVHVDQAIHRHPVPVPVPEPVPDRTAGRARRPGAGGSARPAARERQRRQLSFACCTQRS